jgi:hypothetical protein
MMWSLFKAIVVTGMLLGVLMLTARSARQGRLTRVVGRFQGGASGGASELSVEQRVMLNKDTQLAHLRWGNTDLLVGVSTGGVSVLDRRTRVVAAQDASFEEAFESARVERGVEDGLADTLLSTSALERLRHITARIGDRR